MTVSRENAKVRGLRRDLEREKRRRMDAEIALHAVSAFVASDHAASQYQTLGQYRTVIAGLIARLKPRESTL